jgi:ferredoxin-thioredoxin reductase catalytic subunit/glutaredoxin
MEGSSEHEEHLRKARHMVTSYSGRGPYRANPDPEVVEGLIQALARQWDRFGYMFCPCRPVTGDFAQDRPKICPCVWHRDEIAVDGHCRCGLFVSPDYDPEQDPFGRNVLASDSPFQSPFAHEIVLYTTPWCRGSRQTKAFLHRYGLSFREVNLEVDPEAVKLVEGVNEGNCLTPTIFIDGEYAATEPDDMELARILGVHFAPPITLYTTPWCRDSRRVKKFLSSYGIPFQDIDVEKDEEAAELVKGLNDGFLSVPTVFVDGEHVATEPSNQELAMILGLPHFAEVILYIEEGNPECEQLIAFLRAHKVPYTAVDVGISQAAMDKVCRRAGQCVVPILEIGEQILVRPELALARQALGLST